MSSMIMEMQRVWKNYIFRINFVLFDLNLRLLRRKLIYSIFICRNITQFIFAVNFSSSSSIFGVFSLCQHCSLFDVWFVCWRVCVWFSCINIIFIIIIIIFIKFNFYLLVFIRLDNWREYDSVLSRLSAHRTHCWRAITPNEDSSQDSPILAAKFANCDNYRNTIAIANEDGQVRGVGITTKSIQWSVC